MSPSEALEALGPWFGGGLFAISLMLGAVKYVIRSEIRSQVNGKIDDLDSRLDGLEDRLVRRDRQLVSALSRQGVQPPDGWDKRSDDPG